eukprot:CAMPEP_0204247208 /NCGR_PEP_ID=MMETSP0361-20130328/98533_1 /ASSEMBLY_ACC=CAM_ASM_000343 /TAXON_ID=268821 /ORGANISM="Scrippsiella Hangoei, Strain SHTV-5" /LENGTH=645 /DNA_ID=CAMNT_0051220441 /DNA_START=20 /DNA_END=1957 /DNA_ORIENTATION=+
MNHMMSELLGAELLAELTCMLGLAGCGVAGWLMARWCTRLLCTPRVAPPCPSKAKTLELHGNGDGDGSAGPPTPASRLSPSPQQSQQSPAARRRANKRNGSSAAGTPKFDGGACGDDADVTAVAATEDLSHLDRNLKEVFAAVAAEATPGLAEQEAAGAEEQPEDRVAAKVEEHPGSPCSGAVLEQCEAFVEEADTTPKVSDRVERLLAKKAERKARKVVESEEHPEETLVSPLSAAVLEQCEAVAEEADTTPKVSDRVERLLAKKAERKARKALQQQEEQQEEQQPPQQEKHSEEDQQQEQKHEQNSDEKEEDRELQMQQLQDAKEDEDQLFLKEKHSEEDQQQEQKHEQNSDEKEEDRELQMQQLQEQDAKEDEDQLFLKESTTASIAAESDSLAQLDGCGASTADEGTARSEEAPEPEPEQPAASPKLWADIVEDALLPPREEPLGQECDDSDDDEDFVRKGLDDYEQRARARAATRAWPEEGRRGWSSAMHRSWTESAWAPMQDSPVFTPMISEDGRQLYTDGQQVFMLAGLEVTTFPTAEIPADEQQTKQVLHSFVDPNDPAHRLFQMSSAMSGRATRADSASWCRGGPCAARTSSSSRAEPGVEVGAAAGEAVGEEEQEWDEEDESEDAIWGVCWDFQV